MKITSLGRKVVETHLNLKQRFWGSLGMLKCKQKVEFVSRMSEGIKLINNLQKLIRMADASELGWRFVDEYITNPLASDEEHEKG